MSFAVRQDSKNRVTYHRVHDLKSDIHQGIRSGFLAYMKALKTEANTQILKGTKTGAIRSKRNNPRIRHQAGAPGETHANDTGALRRSLSWKVFGWERAQFGYGVSTSRGNRVPKYAKFLEFGTRMMKPRPSLRNAVSHVRIDQHFEHGLDKNVKRGGGFGK